MRNIIFSLLPIVLIATLAKVSEGAEYASPAWMDNEHIICVKYVDTVKGRFFGWFGDISDARNILTRQEIQIVSMDIQGKNEKVIKDIIIDYPGQSPKWREEIFKGVRRISNFSYNQNRQRIAFGTNAEIIFIISLDGKIAKKIAESAGGPYFSPDDNYLQYTSNYKVWLYDLEGGNRRVLIENAGGGPWSPDGKKIVFSRKEKDRSWQYEVYIYDVETKKEVLFSSQIAYVEAWSPTGKLITGSRLLLNPRVSPDGTKIVGEPHSDPIREKGRINYIGICDIDEKNLRVLRYYAEDK